MTGLTSGRRIFKDTTDMTGFTGHYFMPAGQRKAGIKMVKFCFYIRRLNGKGGQQQQQQQRKQSVN